ncbi:hypothetical protein MIT9_P2140 [Methylomarinovum caldicuralii]|uniref:Uncharacterized protein n=1 Tax=Methylomarinovum caldicuralii TaxID=438856 RepID=A0AAU9C5Z0_9GAMM|nr:hypothetical protein [Methylomarinovum caldicuralii]BCX82554.1 hypothetical protein MIT9_P2140 [Methylomarinovum caldicuralii]
MTTKPLHRAISLALLAGAFVSTEALAANASYDPATQTVTISAVDVPRTTDGVVKTFSATLKLVPGTDPIELELTGAQTITTPEGIRSGFDATTGEAFIPSVTVGSNEYAATLKLIPGSIPLRFQVIRLHPTQFTQCPDFAQPLDQGACLLQGEINQDVTLTNEITWLLSGGVFVGGDNTNSATLTIEPGTRIEGQQAADFLYIRRGSKIHAVGTPSQPIIMTGPLEQTPGEWGGLVLAGNAPVNGCNPGVDPCVQFNEALSSEPYGGSDPKDSSGIIKYLQIRYAGYPVRPDQELNGLTLTGVGSGTVLDFIEVFEAADDGIEHFGGTDNIRHVVLVNVHDDSVDWGWGWRGSAQFVVIKQTNDSDRCIEADNNENNFDSTPRAQPVIANMTCIGNPNGSQAVMLRRGTGANIVDSVFVDTPVCLKIDDKETYDNAGTPDNLTGKLTIEYSYVNCPTNFKDGKGATFSVADWFRAQPGNVEADPLLDGYLPGAGSPLLTGGAGDSFTITVPGNDSTILGTTYIGAVQDAEHDWTKYWTTWE